MTHFATATATGDDPIGSARAAAYDRALRDYTQLLRHRIANPLTAITAGLATLRDIEVDDATRAEIMATIFEQARALERVALQPLVIGEEEAELQPMVDSVRRRRGVLASGDDLRAAAQQRRAGHNESQFRTVNTRIVLTAGADHPLVEIACECSSLDCADAVHVTHAEYTTIHAHGARFIIAHGHDDAEIEHIVDRRRDWSVVEKLGPARDQAIREHRADRAASVPDAA